MMERLNILISGNDSMLSGMEVVIYSLLTHTKYVNIFVCTATMDIKHNDGSGIIYHELSEDQKNKLTKIVKYLDHNSNIMFIDPTELYLKHLAGSVNEESSFSPFATFRLMADLLFPELDHILHLDCDVAITKDIRPVYLDYLNRSTEYSAWVGRAVNGDYGEMVSGVVLFNLTKIRQTKFLERARRNYMNNRYVYPDQYALRDAGDPETFPYDFGYCDDLFDVKELPTIIHFTNKISPKIYFSTSERFFRLFPFLQYIKDGLRLIDTINHK